MLTESPAAQLSELLELAISDFDIPPEVHRLAEGRYHAVGDFLDSYWGPTSADGHIYPQGSFALGTVVAPIAADADYDIDLVCRRELRKTSTSQASLKQDVGRGLASFRRTSAEGDPSLGEGKRCWTLGYPHERFHMDVLPAIPNDDAQPNGILITDTSYSRWLSSNPVDYATWFKGRMVRDFEDARYAAAVAKQMEVDQVPEWQVKTSLQRTVQAFKRHRDIHFMGREDVKPASIIITTLAALAYRGGGDLAEVIRDVARTMPDLIVTRGGVLWLPNPVQPDENFADRLQSEPARKEAFFEWLELIQGDLFTLTEQLGLDQITTKFASFFGGQSARAAREGFGSGLLDARKQGILGSAAGNAMLGRTSANRRPVPDHAFHGGAKAPRS